MEKRDILIVAVLVALWLAWPTIDQHVIRPYIFDLPPVEETVPVVEGEDGAAATQTVAVTETALTAPEKKAPPESPEPAPAPADEREERPDEAVAILQNDKVQFEVSSWGGGIVSATLNQYDRSLENTNPVVMSFGEMPALAYRDLPGLDASGNFEILAGANGHEVRLRAANQDGLMLERTLELNDAHTISVTDKWINDSDGTLRVDGASVQVGPMEELAGGVAMRGLVVLGVDTLSPGDKVRHWGKKIDDYFKKEMKEDDLLRLPQEVFRCPHDAPQPIDWVAAKNKYFAQILHPENGGEYALIYARRIVTEEERANPAYQPGMEGVEAVGAVIALPSWSLEPGEVLKTEMSYYAGPKKYAELHELGFHKVRVMEFGFFRPISELLLRALNGVHRWIWPHNYGLAIIILTIVIRIIFWPITHKSTESMKRMQEIQPLAQELREKHKDNPQKQQQELMALYKEHKVNPVGGCLPMLIQIPVFIGLFTVLRSAIELRFSSFLWIRDLSQPENLFADVLPFPFNPLPLVMAGTMFWQQKLTTGGSTGGETQQQKMMAFMPLLLLFIFYRMPSGLVLYWTTNQCLMIIQQLVSKKKKAAEAAA